MADNIMKGVVMGFIAILLGAIFLGVVADQNSAIGGTFTATNESFTGVNGTLVNLSNTDVVAVSAVRNSTHDAQTVSVDYTVGTTGITIINGDNGTYYADYTYHHVNYVENSTTRALIAVLVVLFAVAVLAVAMGETRIKELLNL